MKFIDFIGSEPVLFSVLISAFIAVLVVILALCFHFIGKNSAKMKRDKLKGYFDALKKSEPDLFETIRADSGAIPRLDPFLPDKARDLTGVPESTAKRGEKNDLIIDSIRQYYDDALSQSDILFWVSICATAIGFLLIIVVIVVSIVRSDAVVALETAPGIIINIIASLFFKQVHDTRTYANSFFHDLLREMQVEKSKEYADAIEDDDLRPIIQAKIALHLAGLSEKAEDLLKCSGGGLQMQPDK